MERRGGQQWRATEDSSIDERLQQKTLCHQQWTDECVESPETFYEAELIMIMIVWLQWLLVDVVHHTGKLAPDHVDICTPEQWVIKWRRHFKRPDYFECLWDGTIVSDSVRYLFGIFEQLLVQSGCQIGHAYLTTERIIVGYDKHSRDKKNYKH